MNALFADTDFSKDKEENVTWIKTNLRNKLELCAVTTSDVRSCWAESDTETTKGNLEALTVAAWNQQSRAERAFDLLDEAGKGMIVLEDLERVAAEFLGDSVTRDDLEEMIREVDSTGDGLLNRTSICRLAREINL
jgi:hypothetical protein